jgi:hypothetical protein
MWVRVLIEAKCCSVKLSPRLLDEFRIPDIMPHPLHIFERDLKKMGARVKQLSIAGMIARASG